MVFFQLLELHVHVYVRMYMYIIMYIPNKTAQIWKAKYIIMYAHCHRFQPELGLGMGTSAVYYKTYLMAHVSYVLRYIYTSACTQNVFLAFITGYGSTLYIGIAMVFVFSAYILKYSSYFQFQVSLTFNEFTAQYMSK